MLFSKRIRLTLFAIGAIAGGVLLLSACAGPAGPAGPAGTIGPAGPQGPTGPLPEGIERQLNASVSVSQPANGTHFIAGEQAVLTITLKDQNGKAFDRAADFSQLRLMLAGPQEPIETVTAVKLLKASTDRSQTEHHYIDLTKSSNVQANGTELTYQLAGVTGEKPGTYIASVWAVEKAAPLQQKMVTAELQIGTATAEKQIVEKEKCAQCHLGADSGKFYFAHIDVGFSPVGNPSIDQGAPENCKTCHNNDGYAAYVDPRNADNRISDPLVKRVHGVHFGEELSNPDNINLENGLFKDYRGVVFPADILNCNYCHVDDRWKTQPSRLACGTCHDNIDWATGKSVVAEKPNHEGGPQANDNNCKTCHQADNKSVSPSMTAAHNPTVNTEHDDIVLTVSAPRNGKYFASGEKPLVTIVIKDANGKAIDHTRVNSATFAAANFYVHGPRASSTPVLTTAAKVGISASRASATNSRASTTGWAFEPGDTFKIAINGGAPQIITAPTGQQTPDQVAAWLRSNLKDVTVTPNNIAGTVNILSSVAGDKSRLEFYNSPIVAKMGWKPYGLDITEHGVVVGQTVGTTVEPYVVIGTLSTVPNDLRSTTDTAVVRTAGSITYQLDDVAGLKPGTYVAYSYANLVGVTTQNGWARDAFGLVTFQVGTETPEPKVAGNCETCHGHEVMHLNERNVHPYFFDTDGCKACHDYGRPGTGEGYSRTGGTSTNGWAGYGAKPISARVHGVHRGAYLNHKEDVYAGNPNMASEIIFPQDIRNCSVCHDKTTSGTWKTEPSRLACLSCHDSNGAKAHGTAMTLIPAGSDPLGPNAIETCKVCHGAGKDLSVETVHNISNPYQPPYPRAAE